MQSSFKKYCENRRSLKLKFYHIKVVTCPFFCLIKTFSNRMASNAHFFSQNDNENKLLLQDNSGKMRFKICSSCRANRLSSPACRYCNPVGIDGLSASGIEQNSRSYYEIYKNIWMHGKHFTGHEQNAETVSSSFFFRISLQFSLKRRVLPEIGRQRSPASVSEADRRPAGDRGGQPVQLLCGPGHVHPLGEGDEGRLLRGESDQEEASYSGFQHKIATVHFYEKRVPDGRLLLLQRDPQRGLQGLLRGLRQGRAPPEVGGGAARGLHQDVGHQQEDPSPQLCRRRGARGSLYFSASYFAFQD